MDERARRLAENEATFRDVNELVDDVARTLGQDEHLYEYLCECSRSECHERIRLTTDEYRRVREYPTRFALVPGHEDPTVERVVGRIGDAAVVEKFGEGADVAAARARR